MKYTGMLAGALLGGRSRVLGAVVGGVLGYQVGLLLEAARATTSRNRRPGERAGGPPQSSNRYPEEEVLEAMRRTDDEPGKQGAELEDIYRSVSGSAKQNAE